MDASSRGVRMDNHSAYNHASRHDRESGRVLKPDLDLRVNGRHISYASAKPSAQPKHSVKWDDSQLRPSTSPEPASSSRHDWAGRHHRPAQPQHWEKHAQMSGVLCQRRLVMMGTQRHPKAIQIEH